MQILFPVSFMFASSLFLPGVVPSTSSSGNSAPLDPVSIGHSCSQSSHQSLQVHSSPHTPLSGICRALVLVLLVTSSVVHDFAAMSAFCCLSTNLWVFPLSSSCRAAFLGSDLQQTKKLLSCSWLTWIQSNPWDFLEEFVLLWFYYSVDYNTLSRCMLVFQVGFYGPHEVSAVQ